MIRLIASLAAVAAVLATANDGSATGRRVAYRYQTFQPVTVFRPVVYRTAPATVVPVRHAAVASKTNANPHPNSKGNDAPKGDKKAAAGWISSGHTTSD